MSTLAGNGLSSIYVDLLQLNNSNSGIGASIIQMQDGAGVGLPIHMSRDVIKLQPTNGNSTTAFQVNNLAGNSCFIVDTTNRANYVYQNTNTASYVNTHYAYFSGTAINCDGSSHHCIPFGNAPTTSMTLGTGTDPDTAVTISSTADDLVNCGWFQTDPGIVIDEVRAYVGANGASGDTVRVHLWKMYFDTDSDATGGDLAGGVVVASGADITNAGYEQMYHQNMTIDSTNKVVEGHPFVLFATIKADGTNSDYSVKVMIRYHTGQ